MGRKVGEDEMASFNPHRDESHSFLLSMQKHDPLMRVHLLGIHKSGWKARKKERKENGREREVIHTLDPQPRTHHEGVDP